MGCAGASVHAGTKVQIAGVNRGMLTLSRQRMEKTMRLALAAVAALVVAATGWSAPAEAQRAPSGSYLASCVDVVARGDNLSATCRKRDGREQRSQISGYRRCTGDIGNDNGVLHCNFPGGPVWGVVTSRGGPPAPAYVPQAPAYVPPPAYAPAPGYAPPPAGWEQARWERCRHLQERVQELRYRREHTYDPQERERIQYRLGRARGELESCR
jgi:hypothetical protein